jgi:hypothetical protein
MSKLAIIDILTFGSPAFAATCRAESGNNGKGYASRPLESGTKISLFVGETVIPAVLNDSKSSQALIAKLPYTVRLQRYEHDYCGVMDAPLPYDEKDMQSGWLNGDIAFAVNGDYFTLLYKDEEISKQFYGIVNMGVLKAPLSVMDTLDQSVFLRIELE